MAKQNKKQWIDFSIILVLTGIISIYSIQNVYGALNFEDWTPTLTQLKSEVPPLPTPDTGIYCWGCVSGTVKIYSGAEFCDKRNELLQLRYSETSISSVMDKNKGDLENSALELSNKKILGCEGEGKYTFYNLRTLKTEFGQFSTPYRKSLDLDNAKGSVIRFLENSMKIYVDEDNNQFKISYEGLKTSSLDVKKGDVIEININKDGTAKKAATIITDRNLFARLDYRYQGLDVVQSSSEKKARIFSGAEHGPISISTFEQGMQGLYDLRVIPDTIIKWIFKKAP